MSECLYVELRVMTCVFIFAEGKIDWEMNNIDTCILSILKIKKKISPLPKPEKLKDWGGC